MSGSYAEFDDYILISEDGYINTRDFIQYHILNKVDGNHVLMDELISVFELGQDEYEFYGNLMQRLNNRIDILAMQNVEGTDKQLIDYKAMRDKLTKYASQYGIDKTVTMIGKWIMGEGQL